LFTLNVKLQNSNVKSNLNDLMKHLAFNHLNIHLAFEISTLEFSSAPPFSLQIFYLLSTNNSQLATYNYSPSISFNLIPFTSFTFTPFTSASRLAITARSWVSKKGWYCSKILRAAKSALYSAALA